VALDRRQALVLEPVRRFLRRQAYPHLLNLLAKVRPGDFGAIYDGLTEREQISLFKVLAVQNPRLGSRFVVDLPHEGSIDLIRRLDHEASARLLEHCAENDAAFILSGLSADESQPILELMHPEEKATVEKILIYPEETAGRLMTPDVFSVHEDLTAGEAIAALQSKRDIEIAFYLYVVDQRNHLVGVLSLRELLTHPPLQPVREFMSTDLITVRTDTDQEEVARIAAKYDLLATPVVDDQGRLVGVVTIDDVMDVLREEATEDIMRLAGTSEEERIEPSITKSARTRAPWLLATFGGGFIASIVINGFSSTLSGRLIGLAAFIPIILGMGGSAGTQSAIVMIRGLATGRVKEGEFFAAFLRESGVAASLGLMFGSLLVGGAYTALLIRGQATGSDAIREALVIGLSLAISMMLATVIGAALPLGLHKLGIDPAVSATPFVTTSMDVLGTLIFFSLASLLILG
jgi:magnesium transporter